MRISEKIDECVNAQYCHEIALAFDLELVCNPRHQKLFCHIHDHIREKNIDENVCSTGISDSMEGSIFLLLTTTFIFSIYFFMVNLGEREINTQTDLTDRRFDIYLIRKIAEAKNSDSLSFEAPLNELVQSSEPIGDGALNNEKTVDNDLAIAGAETDTPTQNDKVVSERMLIPLHDQIVQVVKQYAENTEKKDMPTSETIRSKGMVFDPKVRELLQSEFIIDINDGVEPEMTSTSLGPGRSIERIGDDCAVVETNDARSLPTLDFGYRAGGKIDFCRGLGAAEKITRQSVNEK